MTVKGVKISERHELICNEKMCKIHLQELSAASSGIYKCEIAGKSFWYSFESLLTTFIEFQVMHRILRWSRIKPIWLFWVSIKTWLKKWPRTLSLRFSSTKTRPRHLRSLFIPVQIWWSRLRELHVRHLIHSCSATMVCRWSKGHLLDAQITAPNHKQSRRLPVALQNPRTTTPNRKVPFPRQESDQVAVRGKNRSTTERSDAHKGNYHVDQCREGWQCEEFQTARHCSER